MGRRHNFILLILTTLLALQPFARPAAWGQSPSPVSQTPTPSGDRVDSAETLEERLAEVETRLQEAPRPALAETLERPGQAPPYYNSLLRMETSLRRLISLQENDALLHAQLKRAEAEAREFTQKGLPEQRPYPITLLDELQYGLSLADDDLAAQQASLEAARANAKVQAVQLEDRQSLRRRLLGQDPGPAGELDHARATENVTWAVEAAETAREPAEAEVKNAEKAVTLARNRRELLSRKVDLVKAQFQFTRAMLEQRLASLDAERAELNSSLEEVRASAARALETVKGLPASTDPVAVARRTSESEWLTTYQRQKILLEQALELNLTKRDLWERRFASKGVQALNSLSDWEAATRGLLHRLENARETLQAQLEQLRRRMSGLVESVPLNDSAIEEWSSSQARALAAHQSALEAALAETNEAYVLAQRLLGELQDQRQGLSWRQRVSRGWAALVEFWNIELYTLGDSSVTVGKVNMALLVLLLGLTLVGRSTRMLSRRLLSRLPMPDGVRANIERAMRYLFISLVFLFALRVVNIPLTIFTFLGGTLAIAVGFGAQNILNNFISGLILMVERPVRVGDMIEVDQTTGIIEEIGARSTRVRMGTGIHVVLPNSHLLENRVINWTLIDQRVRTSVSVGVAYGSPPEEVISLLTKAAMSQEMVEKTPEPFVVLEEFSDSSLKFGLHFWVSVAEPLNKLMTESKLRLAIEQLFRENGIIIAFPQLDLNISLPLPVKIANDRFKETPQN